MSLRTAHSLCWCRRCNASLSLSRLFLAPPRCHLWPQVQALSGLPRLAHLLLDGNPVCSARGYPHVIAFHAPQLRSLDGRPVPRGSPPAEGAAGPASTAGTGPVHPEPMQYDDGDDDGPSGPPAPTETVVRLVLGGNMGQAERRGDIVITPASPAALVSMEGPRSQAPGGGVEAAGSLQTSVPGDGVSPHRVLGGDEGTSQAGWQWEQQLQQLQMEAQGLQGQLLGQKRAAAADAAAAAAAVERLQQQCRQLEEANAALASEAGGLLEDSAGLAARWRALQSELQAVRVGGQGDVGGGRGPDDGSD